MNSIIRPQRLLNPHQFLHQHSQLHPHLLLVLLAQVMIHHLKGLIKLLHEDQKYSRLRCLLCVKGLVTCFYLGWSGSVLHFRQNIIKLGSNSWLVTCNSNIPLKLPSYTGSALKRELNFCNGCLSLLYF